MTYEQKFEYQAQEEARKHAVTVFEVIDATPWTLKALNRLLPQLSSSAEPMTMADLQEMVDSPAIVLFLARDGRDGPIVGTLTLALFRLPSGIRAWIEDVITDTEARGKGVGAALNQAALWRARQAGAKTVDLTSRPSREAANRLYQRLGFEPRETNVYRYDLS
jgi:ribosomal protein S18 acetylase RimI-like enzyme